MHYHAVTFWRYANFTKLWLSQTISALGSHIAFIALPLTAVLVLHASAFEMGLLTAFSTLPYLVLGLPIGVLVDRVRRRPLIIAADVARALMLLTIPAAALNDMLTIEHLYVVAGVIGICTVVYDVAVDTFLPSVVAPADLLDGNRKLAAADSAIEIAGPGLGSWLVQWLTAPLAVLLNGLPFIVSGLIAMAVHSDEMPPRERLPRLRIGAEIIDGLRFVRNHPLLLPVTGIGLVFQLFGGVFDALLTLFVVRDLRLEPWMLGLFFSLGSAASMVGAVLSRRIVVRWGVGTTTAMAALLMGTGWFLVPWAGGSMWVASAVLSSAFLLTSVGTVLFNIATTSLIQTETPAALLGRVNASKLFLSYGALPIGSVLGGVLGATLGVRTTLLIAGVGLLLGSIGAVLSLLRRQKLKHQRPTMTVRR